MPNLGSVTKFFPTPFENSLAMTLNGTIAPGAATVGVNNLGNYVNGQVVVFRIDSGTANAQVFTGTVSGSNIVNVVWTYGTNVAHTDGVAIVDYVSSTSVGMISKGVQQQHNQDGTHAAITAPSAVFSGSVTAASFIQSGGAGSSGWTVGLATPNTVTALGNRSYSCVFNGVNLTGTLSNGMRLRTTRTVAAPTQCTSLNGTTQFYSKTTPAGMTFTNNFVVSGWIKATSYGAASVASRWNGTSGWDFGLNASGQVQLFAWNAGAGNFSGVTSYQSVPLNKWVHITAQLDMATFTATTITSYTMIDGVDVPASVSRAGTNPTALVQAGNLEIGSRNAGTQPFPGKIAQVAIYSAKVTQATILASISQGLAGTETSLISAYSFNNSINDLNANANNLTANGSALATNADSPFGGQADGTISSTLDYAIVTKTAFSTDTTLTVQVPEGCTIPTSGGVSAVSYSTQKVPYLFPAQRGKWTLLSLIASQQNSGSIVTAAYANVASWNINIPIGSFNIGYQVKAQTNPASGSNAILVYALSTSNSSFSDIELMGGAEIAVASGALPANGQTVYRNKSVDLTSATPYYFVLRNTTPTVNATLYIRGDDIGCILFAELALL